MKRAHRRSHLIIWIILFPAIVAGAYFALKNRTELPVEPRPDLGRADTGPSAAG